ncbi:MAG: hypothetical protein M3410_00135 [Acidobacteriota bacterium]|nr:hypothetical protein [Acidobacteriota bacterium]
MTVVKTRLLIIVIICFVMLAMLAPIETTVIPPWRIQVVDVNGTSCPNMRVTESWGHYRLYLDGNESSDDRFTDANGYVQFPERKIRASVSRRIMMPIVTRITTIMHGGWRVSGAVWASGIKEVAWLSYHGANSLPDKMRVEKCINDGAEQALGANSP